MSRYTVCCVKNCLKGRAQRVVVGQSSKGCSEWAYIWLVTSHHWDISGLNSRASSIFLSVIWMQELKALLASLQTTPNWEVLLTLLRDKRPCRGF